MSIILKKLRSQKGGIGVFVVVTLAAVLLVMTSMINLNLASLTAGSAWDVFHQRTIEARAVANAVKEGVLAFAGTEPVQSTNSLATEISNRATAVTTGTSGITVTSNASNAAVTLPLNPQWPSGTPVAASTPNFSSILGVGRNLQALLSAGPIADLGTSTFNFTETNTSLNGETPTYQVAAHLFSVPLSNFTWISYGNVTVAGGVATSAPTAPAFARSNGFASPLVNSYSGESGTFPEMFGGIGSALPGYFYRDLVSLTWDAFSYWTSLSYQNLMLGAAGSSSTFDFTNPTNLPSGVTWSGSAATVNLGTTTASVIVFVDSLGGNTLNITGAAATGNPVVVVIRNFSATPTTISLQGNNSRSTVLYAPNSTISATSSILFRGAVLLFSTSAVTSSFSINGLVAYPQSFAGPPSLTAYPDAQAQSDLAAVVPRALLVSVRGTVH